MTYDYECSNCGHVWEQEQSIKDEAITNCPVCKNDTAKRLISKGTGFILQGGGWAKDNYK